MTHDLILAGCRPVPLAHYLKALGVLRLVAEQRDPSARGFWRRDQFVLRSSLDRSGLEQFFLEEYRPTPIVAPWNGGSGFYPKDNKKAIETIVGSNALRFAEYRETISAARELLSEMGVSEKVDDEKATLLELCRNRFPDHTLRWLDTTYVISADGAKYPPLLGTGGNDGRLDFTNNFMQRLVWLIDAANGEPTPVAGNLLESALFDTPSHELAKGTPIGQFLPSQAGGANASSGFGADSLVNPWDFVLSLEGATTFAASSACRMDRKDSGTLSFPFTVRPVAAGYASASQADETSSRPEIWLPLWRRPASALEVQALFSEGRARIGHRTARNGIDFARAVAGLGVDRGIEAFQRYGFQVRNGLAYFAVPAGRFDVRAEPRTALLSEIDDWLDNFRRRASAKTAPASASRCQRQLDAAILDLCGHGDQLRLQQVLVALGDCEQVMATTDRWTEESFLHPVPALSPAWLRLADDGSTEFRLAASLATVVGRYGPSQDKRVLLPIRRQMEPVETWRTEAGLRVGWDSGAGPDVAWTSGHLADVLNAVMHRRILMANRAGVSTYPDQGRLTASLGDIADFIEGRVDDGRLAEILWGCILIDWSRIGPHHFPRPRPHPGTPFPAAFYALLKLCFAGPNRFSQLGTNQKSALTVEIPIVPQIHRLASAGRGAEASREAIRRLGGSGLALAVPPFEVRGDIARRSAAALLFPISERDRWRLQRVVVRPEQAGEADDSPETETLSGVVT